MNKIITVIFFIFVLYSCTTSKNYLSKKNTRNDLKNIEKINKSSPVINIIIDSIDENNFLSNGNWGDMASLLSNRYFQKRLLSDLQNTTVLNDNTLKFSFYSESDAIKNHVKKNWIINLKIIKLDEPVIHVLYSSNSEIIQSLALNTTQSVDASFGTPAPNPIYNYTTVQNSSNTYSIYINTLIELHIKNGLTGKNLKIIKMKGIYEWHQTIANTPYPNGVLKPGPEDIFKKLYSKLYPKIESNLNRVINSQE